MNRYRLPISRILSLETPDVRFVHEIGMTAKLLAANDGFQWQFDRQVEMMRSYSQKLVTA